MANRLFTATSPYLQQHAQNPVDWYPWGEEALRRAKAEDKLILVSIGYSACHWCHVMERECFENPDIAAIMNENFVCIKVDREERPDVDQVYMDAMHALGQQGGWPLNVFLLPDERPFFGGTYFAPPSWTQVLLNIARAFRENRARLESTAQALKDHLGHQVVTPFPLESAADFMVPAFRSLATRFDRTYGGFDRAPKFILPAAWRWLIAYQVMYQDTAATDQLMLTLCRIAEGGIHDPVNGGFARYAVDNEWFAPHFEKMLYDNAQLLGLYAEAYALSGFTYFMDVCESLTGWLQHEMTSPEGGFYSALDADSEGVEGYYYTWTYDELAHLLGSDFEAFKNIFNITPEGNWEHGRNILARHGIYESWQTRGQLNVEFWLDVALEKLRFRAESRIRPGLDHKIILAWNAQTIIGLLTAHRYTSQDSYRTLASRALRFLESTLITPTEVFRVKSGTENIRGFLDDYAFTIAMYIELYQSFFDDLYLEKAVALLHTVLKEFQDPMDGFFYYTSSSDEPLFTRRKEVMDNVIPSSNAVMAGNLLRLGYMLGKDDWYSAGLKLVDTMKGLIVEDVRYGGQWGLEAFAAERGFCEVVICGPGTEAMRNVLQQNVLPATLFLTSSPLLPTTFGKTILDGRTTIYVCRNRTCQLPVHTKDEALRLLK